MMFKAVYCLPSLKISCLQRAHKFSIGFKSDKEGSQGIIQSILKPFLANQAVEYLDTRDGALSYIKISLLEYCWLPPMFDESNFYNLAVVLEVDFLSIFNKKGPTSSSLIIVAHTIIPLPLYKCLTWTGALCSLVIQPWAHLVTLISFVLKTFEKSVSLSPISWPNLDNSTYDSY